MNFTEPLRIGIPKGSLEEATIAIFARSGWKIATHHRNYFPEINDPELTARLCRAQEIGMYVMDGVLDVGITGRDWIQENNADVVMVSDLVYSKVSRRPARWVLAVAGDSPFQRPEDLEGRRIATELVGVSRRYFEERGINVKVQYSWGATEAKVVDGLADAIVEVTETGTTIHAHGLRIIDVVMESCAVLIANRSVWNDPAKRRKIEQINLLLHGALRADTLVGLKMNVPGEHLEQVIEQLPSLNSPTVAGLRNSTWFSVEIVVDTDVVRDLIPRLCEAGAEGIIEYSLNKVI